MNMKRPSKPCRDQGENISLLATGLLPDAEQASLREHLARCASCHQYYEEIVSLTGKLKQWASPPPVEAGAPFRARWMRAVENVDHPAKPWLAAVICRWGEWLWPSPLAWGGMVAVWVCLLTI